MIKISKKYIRKNHLQKTVTLAIVAAFLMSAFLPTVGSQDKNFIVNLASSGNYEKNIENIKDKILSSFQKDSYDINDFGEDINERNQDTKNRANSYEFGYQGTASTPTTLEDRVAGTWGEVKNGSGTADYIMANLIITDGTYTGNITAGLYEYTDWGTDYAGNLIAQTETKTITSSNTNPWWEQFNFTNAPTIQNNTRYYIIATAENCDDGTIQMRGQSTTPGYSVYEAVTYSNTLENPWLDESPSSYRRAIYCSYHTGNMPPTLTNENPEDNNTNIPLQPICSIKVTDPDADSLTVKFYENTTGTWTLRQTNSSMSSGNSAIWDSYTNANQYNTKYFWQACITDGTSWTNQTYCFTTLPEENPPENTNPRPTPGTLGVNRQPTCSITISDLDADTLTTTIYENATGTWTLRQTNTTIPSDTTITWNYTNANQYHTRYWWSVNTSDGNGGWDNDTYWFQTESSPSTENFGYSGNTNFNTPLENRVVATWDNADSGTGTAEYISAYLSSNSGTYTGNITAGLYEYTDWGTDYAGNLIAQTETKTITITDTNPYWEDLYFIHTPTIEHGTRYYLAVSAENNNAGDDYDISLRAQSSDPGYSIFENIIYSNTLENPWVGDASSSYHRAILCYYTPEGNSPPVISDEYPADESNDITISPVCNVTVLDDDQDSMTVEFYENTTGSWVLQQINTTIPNGTTITWNYTNANQYNTKYYWRVCIFDGLFWKNNTYSFTTEQSPYFNDFGYFSDADTNTPLENRLVSTWGETTNGDGLAESISVLIGSTSGSYTGDVIAGLYEYTDWGTDFAGSLIAQTEIKTISISTTTPQWIKFNFTESNKPIINNNTKYYIAVSGESNNDGDDYDITIMAKSDESGYSIFDNIIYSDALENPWMGESASSYHRAIYCSYMTGSPIISSVTPPDESIGTNLFPECRVTLFDTDDDLMDVHIYENTTGSWILQQTTTGVSSGGTVVWNNYSNASNLNTKYYWQVCVYDGLFWVNNTYSFTTISYEPVIYNPIPEANKEDVSVSITELNFTLYDYQNDIMSYSVTMIPDNISSPQTGTFVANGTVIHIPIYGPLNYSTTYLWSVNVTDGVLWTNKTYSFTTELTPPAFTNKWTTSMGGGIARPFLQADVNSDGNKEIILRTGNTMRCFSSEGNQLWTYYNGGFNFRGGPSMETGDLNNDGIPEVLIGITDSEGKGGLVVLHGNNGTVYWTQEGLDGTCCSAFGVVFDFDKDGYPTVLWTTRDGNAAIYSFTYDGQINCKNNVLTHPCAGGQAIMDCDNDGHFEIYVGDTASNGGYVRSFWVDNLTLKWSAHLGKDPYSNPVINGGSCECVLVDVDGDGVREVISHCARAPLWSNRVGYLVMSADDGEIRYVEELPGGIFVFGPAVYDIDNDGNPELFTSASRFNVLDLTTRTLELSISNGGGSFFQPKIGDVTGDGKMDIILPSDGKLRIFEYDSSTHTYNESHQITLESSGSPCVSITDIDNDDLVEIVATCGSYLQVFDTVAPKPVGGVRSDKQDFSEYRNSVAEYVSVLTFKDEIPERKSTFVDLNPTLSVNVTNFQYELMNVTFRTNASGIWQDIVTYNDVGDGTYYAYPIDMNANGQKYWWSVNATDRINTWNNYTYSFTTFPIAPIVNNPYPEDNAHELGIQPTLSVNVSDLQGDIMNIAFWTNATGSWQIIGTNMSVLNGTYSQNTINMAMYNTTYWWSVNATDPIGSRQWTNETFCFKTMLFPLDTKIENITPYEQTSSPINLVASNNTNVEDITLYYRYSTDNSSWENANSISSILNIAFIVNNPEYLDAGKDLPYYERMTNNLGYNVELKDCNDGAFDISNYNCVVISESASSATTTWLKNAAVPVLTMEAYNWNQLSLGTNGDYNNENTDVAIIDNTHYITEENYIGSLPFYLDSSGTGYISGFKNDVKALVTVDGNTSRGVVLAVDKNGILADGSEAIEKRAFFGGQYASNLNTNAWDIWDQCLRWIGGSFWILWDDVSNPDVSPPWSWDFNYPFSTGYYEFSSIGVSSDPDVNAEIFSKNCDTMVYYVGPEPTIPNINPNDGAENVAASIAEISFELIDKQNDSMDYYISTTPDIGSDTVFGVENGIYSLGLHGVDYSTAYVCHINVTDGIHWTNKSIMFSTVYKPSLWWDSEWLYRKPIEINHNYINEDLTNFPVLIDLFDNGLSSHTQFDGEDILFTDVSGNRLNHELVLYDNVEGHLIAWVNVTDITCNIDTVIYLYYGNSGCGSQENIEGTWSLDYRMVHHLDETSGAHYDSTSYGNDGTWYEFNSWGSQDWEGQIDSGVDFFDDYIFCGNDSSLTISEDMTLSAWINTRSFDDSTSDQTIFIKGDVHTDGNYQLDLNNGNNLRFYNPSLGIGSDEVEYNLGSYSSNNWYYVTCVYNGSSVCLYVDGYPKHEVNTPGTINTNDDALYIGSRDMGTTNYWNGALDEIRVSSSSHNASWIYAEFQNQKYPDSFITVGAQEIDTPIVTDQIPFDNAVDIDLTPTLSIRIMDYQDQNMTLFFNTNASGAWQEIGLNNSVKDGTYYCSNTHLFNQYYSKYFWSVNVTDEGGKWTNETYSFTTGGPPALDVDFVFPTPDDESDVYTQTITVNVSSNLNLSDCRLALLNTTITTPNVFAISIDETWQNKFGFEYPATFVFDLSSVPSTIEVAYRDNLSDAWKILEEKTDVELFNGVECVRFNSTENKAYVSTGFHSDNLYYLRFLNVSSAVFNSTAHYYDNRKAAYSLSNDNWGRRESANPGAVWQGMTNDASDKYQASVHALRMFNIPFSIAINSMGLEVSEPNPPSMWDRMQDELNVSDYIWEPAVHTRTHPCSAAAFLVNGYEWEILGCRDDILENLTDIPYGQHVFEYILGCGYQDNTLQSTAAEEFLFLRAYDTSHNTNSIDYADWNDNYDFYGIGGIQTISYDSVLEARSPSARYYASDVATLNTLFDNAYNSNGICYGMYHGDRYSNSVIYDTRTGIDGTQGSSFMQHLSYISNKTDVWYVANGWLYSYRYVAENAEVTVAGSKGYNYIPMTVVNDYGDTYAYGQMTDLTYGETYFYNVAANDTFDNSLMVPAEPSHRSFTVRHPAPLLSKANPTDSSDGQDINPTLSIYAEHPLDQNMDVTFWSNASESWQIVGSNSSVGNGTYRQTPIDMDEHNTRYYWSVNASDANGNWTNMTCCFTTMHEPGGWWNDDWSYRKEIVIDHDHVYGDLINFPLLINIDNDSDLALHAQESGYDLVFTDYEGIKLNHEIEFFNGTDGSLVAWANITNLSNSTDTVLYLYYGNDACSDQSDVSDTWSADYRLVQHLNENTGLHEDSTTYNNDGTNHGSEQDGSGLLDGCNVFDGTDDYINCGNDASLSISDMLTISGWFNPDSLEASSDDHAIVNKGDTYQFGNYQLDINNGDGLRFYNPILGTGTEDVEYDLSSYPAGEWYYATVVYDGSNIYLYFNGDLKVTKAVSGIFGTNDHDVHIGSVGATRYFDGSLDEIRVSHSAHTEEWIATEYYNQRRIDEFCSIGIEIFNSKEEPILSNEKPINNAENIPINPNLSIYAEDRQGERMEIYFNTNASGTWTNIGSNLSVENGTYYCYNTAEIDAYNTTYWWSVNSTNEGLNNWTNMTFSFTTRLPNQPPQLSKPIPSPDNGGVVLSPILSIEISDVDADQMDLLFRTNSSTGIWHTISQNISVNDGTYTCHNTSEMSDFYTTYWWSVNVTDPLGNGNWTNMTYCFTTMHEPGGWWNDDWSYRKEIVIDHDHVYGDLINFPLLINIDNDSDLALHAQESGYDLVFTNYDGIKLNHEIEFFDGTDGSLVAWANITNLSSSIDTVLYLYYGNDACGDQSDVSDTWSADYRLVQHLNENTGLHEDSTTYNNDGTNHGSEQDGSGLLDGCNVFDGTDDYINCGNDASLSTSDMLTISGWFNPDSLESSSEDHGIICKGDATNEMSYQLDINDGNGLRFYNYILSGGTADVEYDLSSYPAGEWYYATVVYDGSNIYLYFNGDLKITKAVSGTFVINDADVFIGCRSGIEKYFSGPLDEIRVSHSAHTADWIATEYNNQYNTDAFLDIGFEQNNLPGTGWNATLNFIETSGAVDSLVFAEASDASDGQDVYDVPKAGFPPQPYLYAWFSTNLTSPHDKLWHDYRDYPDDYEAWNLSVIWAPSDYVTPTDVTISWNSSIFDQSEYDSILLVNETGVILENMLLSTNYTFTCSAMLPHNFQIVCSVQSEEIDFMISMENGWNLISIPADLPIHKENITINYSGSNFTWDEAVSNGYIIDFIYDWNEAQNTYEFTDTVNPGQGYWIYAYSQCELWISTTNTNNDHISDLLTGWNLNGLPYTNQLGKSNLTIQYDGSYYPWQDAVNSGILIDFIYDWDEVNQNYQFIDVLQPGEGYWIYSYNECILFKGA